MVLTLDSHNKSSAILEGMWGGWFWARFYMAALHQVWVLVSGALKAKPFVAVDPSPRNFMPQHTQTTFGCLGLRVRDPGLGDSKPTPSLF